MTLSHHLRVGALAELLRGGGQDGFQGCIWVSLIRTTLQGDLICRSVDARHQDPISDEWRKDWRRNGVGIMTVAAVARSVG